MKLFCGNDMVISGRLDESSLEKTMMVMQMKAEAENYINYNYCSIAAKPHPCRTIEVTNNINFNIS
jgi:hypothetical protein